MTIFYIIVKHSTNEKLSEQVGPFTPSVTGLNKSLSGNKLFRERTGF